MKCTIGDIVFVVKHWVKARESDVINNDLFKITYENFVLLVDCGNLSSIKPISDAYKIVVTIHPESVQMFDIRCWLFYLRYGMLRACGEESDDISVQEQKDFNDVIFAQAVSHAQGVNTNLLSILEI